VCGGGIDIHHLPPPHALTPASAMVRLSPQGSKRADSLCSSRVAYLRSPSRQLFKAGDKYACWPQALALLHLRLSVFFFVLFGARIASCNRLVRHLLDRSQSACGASCMTSWRSNREALSPAANRCPPRVSLLDCRRASDSRGLGRTVRRSHSHRLCPFASQIRAEDAPHDTPVAPPAARLCYCANIVLIEGGEGRARIRLCDCLPTVFATPHNR